MIKVFEVTKCFDNYKVLDEASLHVRKGTVYGLVGPNGAGKTTLINHINGVLKPLKGTIEIDGEAVYENINVKSKIVNISDDWYYYGNVKDMADFYRSMYPGFNNERYEKMKNIFEIDEKRAIRKLSKGMKKQVAFWLSLSAMPEILILDEPLDGLDPLIRKQILNLVIADVADREMTVLVSSHNLRELEDICDWVGIIHKGKMIVEKPLDDLKGNVHKYQVVFGETGVGEFEDALHISNNGAVYNIILRGTAEETEARIKAFSPVLCEHISLTLEEVFIYELGGLDYDFKNIIL